MADDRIKILAPPKAAHRLGTDLTRRRLLSMGAAGLAGLVVAPGVLAACGGDDSGSSAGGTGGGGSGGGGNHTLNLFTWAEYHSQELLDKFGKVSVTVYNSNEEAIAKLQASGGTSGFDLIVPTGVYIPQMAADNLIQKFDKTRLTNFGNVDPIYLDQTWDPDNKLHDSEGLGLDGLDLRQHRHHDPDRRRGTTSSTRRRVRRAGRCRCSTRPGNLTGLYFWANGIDWTTTTPRQLDACEDYIVNTLASHIKAFDSYPGINLTPGQLRVVERVERRRAPGPSRGRRPRQVHMGPRRADDRALDGQLRASSRTLPTRIPPTPSWTSCSIPETR